MTMMSRRLRMILTPLVALVFSTGVVLGATPPPAARGDLSTTNKASGATAQQTPSALETPTPTPTPTKEISG